MFIVANSIERQRRTTATPVIKEVLNQKKSTKVFDLILAKNNSKEEV
jgi:hypothetical protein